MHRVKLGALENNVALGKRSRFPGRRRRRDAGRGGFGHLKRRSFLIRGERCFDLNAHCHKPMEQPEEEEEEEVVVVVVVVVMVMKKLRQGRRGNCGMRGSSNSFQNRTEIHLIMHSHPRGPSTPLPRRSTQQQQEDQTRSSHSHSSSSVLRTGH